MHAWRKAGKMGSCWASLCVWACLNGKKPLWLPLPEDPISTNPSSGSTRCYFHWRITKNSALVYFIGT